jgi:hypothetical protein
MLAVHPKIFSFDANKNLQAAAYSKGWEFPGHSMPESHINTTGREQLDTTNPRIVSTLIKEFAWSPIEWVGGVRKASNFAAAFWIVLDFDTPGYSLAQCVHEMTQAEICHVIGTTKSHQQQKENAPACDRFRLLMRCKTVMNAETYPIIMRGAMKDFPTADKACKDLARFYFPCREIISAENGYGYLPDCTATVEEVEPHRETKRIAPNISGPPIAKRMEEAEKGDRRTKLNRRVQHFLTYGAYEAGKRHKEILVVAMGMLDAGWNTEEIYQAIRVRTPTEKTDEEIKKCIHWVTANARGK